MRSTFKRTMAFYFRITGHEINHSRGEFLYVLEGRRPSDLFGLFNGGNEFIGVSVAFGDF